MESLLIENATIFTGGSDAKVLNDHAILVVDGVIKKIAPSKELREIAVDRRISAYGQLVMPGFINAHTHFYSAFAKGLTKSSPSRNFSEILKNLWWRLDRKLTLEDSYYSALVGCMDAIKQGCTTLIDHHASPFALPGALNQVEAAVLESGVRASLCYEISDRDGEKVAQLGLNENVEFIKKHKAAVHPRIRAMMGLHASFTIQNPMMEKIAQAVSDLDAGVHVHTAEDYSDQEITQKINFMSVVERWQNWKLLGPNSICAHGIYLSEKELDLLRDSKTILVHNPQSNMNNAVGMMNMIEAVNKGILVGLGTDAMTNRMLEEARVALWAQHILHKDPSVGFGEVLKLLFTNNQEIATRLWGTTIGLLQEGGAADIIIVDYDPSTPMTTENWGGHMIFGVSQAVVDTTIVGGDVLMRHKHLMKCDEEEVMAKSRECAKKLWERF